MQTVSQPTEPLGLFSGKPRPRLYDSVIEALRVHHYTRLGIGCVALVGYRWRKRSVA